MSEHLPECTLSYRCHGFTGIAGSHVMKMDFCTACRRVCICDKLLACEKRVAEETENSMMDFFYWKPSPPHDKHYFADNICAYCVGRKKALDAAREAVEKLAKDTWCDSAPCWGAERFLAAIDALREVEK